MKPKFLLFLFVLSLCFSMSSCVVHKHPHKLHHKEIPPGHAKKKHGKKSAKYYTPGHRKEIHHY